MHTPQQLEGANERKLFVAPETIQRSLSKYPGAKPVQLGYALIRIYKEQRTLHFVVYKIPGNGGSVISYDWSFLSNYTDGTH